MGSLKNLGEEHHCHAVLLDSPVLTGRDQWTADSNMNSNSSPDLSGKIDGAGDRQTPQGPEGSDAAEATDQLTFPTGSSKASGGGGGGGGSTSPSLSSTEDADLVQSQLLQSGCQLDPALARPERGSEVDTSVSHGSVSNQDEDRPDWLGDDKGDSDIGGDVTSGQHDQCRKESGGEKSCPPIRRDVSQEITILVTSHDNCVEDEQGLLEEDEDEAEGEEEEERGAEPERASSPDNVKEEEPGATNTDLVATEGHEDTVEGFIVVANLTSTREVERPQIVESDSSETSRDGVCNAQCEHAEVSSSGSAAADPADSRSLGCSLTAQSEVQQPTEANSPVKCDLNTDLSSRCCLESIHTDTEPTTLASATERKDAGQRSNTNKSPSSESRESLQKAKTLDLSSGRFRSSPCKVVQMQSSLEVGSHSVATSPMTPPEGSLAFFFQASSANAGMPNSNTANEKDFRSVATAPMTPQNLTAPEVIPEVRTAGVEMRSVATAPMSPQNLTAPEAIPDARTAGVEMRSVATAPMSPQNLTAPEAIPDARTVGVEMRSVATAPMSPQNLTAPEAIPDARTAGVEVRSVATAPMSPRNLTAPEGITNARKVGSVQTQVSLEVMCHSVATSPMTPPEGSTGFLFPSPKQVELRSVATAPMSPQGLIAPEVIPEANTPAGPNLIPETDTAGVEPAGPNLIPETNTAGVEPAGPNLIPEPRTLEAKVETQENTEPLQEVSWDEKGMTWDVYGAVVEVAVLGTAIQKHLEKQVKKHRKQPSSGAASPVQNLTQTQTQTHDQPLAEAQSPTDEASSPNTGLAPAGSQKRRTSKEEKNDGAKKNRRRKNPLRGRLHRLQWPSCCSRSRPEEAL